MSTTAIGLIHEAARDASIGTLDQPIYLDRDIGLFAFADFNSGRDIYINVPPDKVVALSHRNFWVNGDTWRTATYRLEGKNWPHAVFDYFESPLEENPFPPSDSRHELRLTNIGGVCECSNGNHRLVAGRAWLTAKHGANAYFRSVKTSSYAVHPNLLGFITDAAASKSDIRTASPIRYQGDCQLARGKPTKLLLGNDASSKIFAWTGDEIVPINIERAHQRQYQWRTTPCALLEGLLDNSWLKHQLQGAKTWSR